MGRRGWPLVAMMALGGCFSHGTSPSPSPETRPAPSVQPSPENKSLPPAPDLEIARALSDTLFLRRLAGDSLGDRQDMEILERLRNAAPVSDSDVISAETDLAEMFDINVARYAEHGRVRYYLDFFKGPARDRMAIWLTRLPVYEPMIRSALTANGLPGDLVYLALIESGYSSTAVSRSKAVGMWQFMKATGRDYGLRVDRWVDDRRDVVKATQAAARHLADLTKKFNGSYYLAAAAYNAGAGKVSRGLKRLGSGAEEDYFEDEEESADLAQDANGDDRFFHLSDTRYLRKETKDYVPKLIAAAMIAKQPEKYGFQPVPKVAAFAVDSVVVPGPTSLDVVARKTGIAAETIAALNPQYLRGITPPDPGRWWIRLPQGDGPKVAQVLGELTPDERVPGFVHVVQKKESLRTIGKRYGLSVTELVDFNPKVNPKVGVKAGTELRVPGLARIRGYLAEDARETAGRHARAAAGGRHRVRKGESLISLAERYGVSEGQLRAWNHLGRKGTLRAGQVLRIGPVRGARAKPGRRASVVTHLVRPGETMAAVARRYGVTVKALMAANGLRTGQGLKAGRRITIPA